MKFYLSSYHIGHRAECLKELVGLNRKALIVPNAGDLWSTYLEENIPRFQSELELAGTQAEVLDLKNYFGKPDKLKEVISRVGLLWVTGGNTFVLRRAMKESGLDSVLPEVLRNTGLVYAGFSAGVCVASPSLKGIHLADEPENVPSIYPNKEVLWDGLDLIDFYIVPHYRSDHSESAMMENVVAYYEEKKLPFHTLADGEALIVDGTKMERVS